MLEAWRDLETCRPIGLIAGLIPWDVMVLWCEVQGLDAEARDILIAAVSYVDREDFAERSKKKPPPSPPPTPQRGR